PGGDFRDGRPGADHVVKDHQLPSAEVGDAPPGRQGDGDVVPLPHLVEEHDVVGRRPEEPLHRLRRGSVTLVWYHDDGVLYPQLVLRVGGEGVRRREVVELQVRAVDGDGTDLGGVEVDASHLPPKVDV